VYLSTNSSGREEFDECLIDLYVPVYAKVDFAKFGKWEEARRRYVRILLTRIHNQLHAASS